ITVTSAPARRRCRAVQPPKAPAPPTATRIGALARRRAATAADAGTMTEDFRSSRREITSPDSLLRALGFHHRNPFAIRALNLHFERIGGGGELLDRDPGLVFLAAHLTFIVVGPRVSLHRAVRDTRHRHIGVVDAVVRVDLLFRAVAHDRDALAGHDRRRAAVMADDRKAALEPVAVVRRRYLSAGTHGTRLHFTFGGPLSHEVPETL